MVIFVFVMCILLTIGCVSTVTDGFQERTVHPKQRISRFIIAMGLAIWGWLIYF